MSLLPTPPRYACLKQLRPQLKPGTAPLRRTCAIQDPWFCTRFRWTCSRRTATARCYSAHTAEPAFEDVTVACRSNGSVTLNIHHPHVQPAEDGTSHPVIIFLPSIPRASEDHGINDSQIISTLSASSNATIVQINYRSGRSAPYPTPIHDVLAGYDYVKSRFALDLQPWTTSRSGRVKKPHLRMGVCGQLVGGSLAAMLGLTESHLAHDRVAAVAVNSPLTDWVFPERQLSIKEAMGDGSDEILAKVVMKKRKSKTRRPSWDEYGDVDAVLSTRNLESLREQLFRKPANYFDPFASPVHFFRSAGVYVPGSPITTPLEKETISECEDPLNALLHQATSKPRKAHRTFPPSNSTLTLPSLRLSTGTQTPLADMNEEFVKLLRRSVVRSVLARADTQALLDRFEEEPLGREERLEMAVAEAEGRVEYHVNEGTGVWGREGGHWREEVEAVGRWFGEVLRWGSEDGG